MYPITPEMTQEQREKLIELLKTIGSGGKGCRSVVVWEKTDRISHNLATEGINAGDFEIVATNNAKPLPGVKGTISHIVGDHENQGGSNK